jgi:hypothetical protein
MDDTDTLKAALRAAIAEARPDGTYTDEGYAQIQGLIRRLTPLTPLPRPVDVEERIAGPWLTLYAQFGPRHTAGKPIAHESRFRFLSFNKLPDRPLRLTRIEQEIRAGSRDYNNVHFIEPVGGGLRALLVVRGTYRLDAAHPQRYDVDFHRVEITGPADATDDEVRRAFGFAADEPIAADFKPPKLSSDVVYCDEELRINLGSMGGVYVLERLHHAGHSVAFDRTAAGSR